MRGEERGHLPENSSLLISRLTSDACFRTMAAELATSLWTRVDTSLAFVCAFSSALPMESDSMPMPCAGEERRVRQKEEIVVI